MKEFFTELIISSIYILTGGLVGWYLFPFIGYWIILVAGIAGIIIGAFVAPSLRKYLNE